MNDGTPDPIAAIRREIDGVDRNLLTLFAERLALGDKLTQLKADQPGLPLRAGREIVLLRRLLASAPATLERELVVEMWRALISANLRRQRVVDVAVGGGKEWPRLFDAARRHFGARTRISHAGEPRQALEKAADNPETVVAVTPWPAAPSVGGWWPILKERRFFDLHLVAGLPVLGPIAEDPDVAVFAAAPTEEAGKDVTLVLAYDPHHRAARALVEAELAGRECARADNVLIRVEGFLALKDPRIGLIERAGLSNVRVLGSYARVP